MTDATFADRRVHPATIAIKFLKDAPRTVIGIPAVLAVTSEIGWVNLALLALAAVVIIALAEWISWRSFRYGIGTGEIVIESGVLSRNRRAIPFERVQDIDIERGPLARLFGLAKARIETGGSGQDEGVLDSITLDEADRLRAAIRAGRVELVAGEDAARVEALVGSELLYAIGPRRLLLLGLFNFSLLYLAVLFGILNTVEPWIPFDIYDPGRWLGFVGEERVRNLTAGGIAAILLIAVFLGVVTGLVTTLLREFGFRLLAEGKRFRRERGLLTRTEVVLPKRRIQLAFAQTGPVRRALGLAELRFQTLGGAGESGGQQSVAPLARTDELARIVEEAGAMTMPGRGSLERIARGHVLRSTLRVGLPLLLLILASAWWDPRALGALLLLSLLPVGAALDRRFSGYLLRDDLLFSAGGLWRQRLWILPVYKAQSLTLSRSPLQRALGLATLAVDTAGAPALGGLRIIDLRVETARELAATVAARLGAARPVRSL
jgi:putative membrane protein